MRAIGIHEDWTATPPGRTPTQVLARFPKSGIGRPFVSGVLAPVQDLRPKVLNAMQPYLDAGTKVIYVSVKTDISTTRNGNWNVRYQELGVYIAQLKTQYGVEIILIPYHEPEDNFTEGADFVHYFNKVFDNVKIGSSSVKVKPCFMLYHWAPGAAGSIGGKTNVPSDWLGTLKMDDGVTVDGYSGRSFPLEQILTEHPGGARFFQNLPSTVRWTATERGWETPSSTNTTNRSALRASTMRREFDWLLSSDALAQRCDDYIVWSSPGTEDADGLVMDAAAEAEIDRFLALAFPTIPIPSPNPSHAQYQFGFEAGITEGKLQGRKSAFTEARDLMADKILSDE